MPKFGTFQKMNEQRREGLAMADKAKGASGPRGRGPSKSKVAKEGISRRAFVAGSAGALAVGGITTFARSSRADNGEVVVMAWTNYVDPEIQKRFTAKTGIAIRGIPADSDQDMFTKVSAGGGDQYDIVFANAGFCPTYHKADLTEPIDLNEVPAAKNLWPIFRTNTDFPYILAADKALLYPSMWASFGICWNSELFKVPPPYSWKSLWDAPKGKVIVQGAGDDFLAIAGLALGFPQAEIYSM